MLVLNILCCCFCRSIRVHTRADVVFHRERENGDIMYVPAFFGTRPEDVNEIREIDIGAIACELSPQVEHWNSRGSGFVIEHVRYFVICITKFRPLHDSSYTPTPKHIVDKHCTVNVKKQRSKMFCVVGAGLPISCYRQCKQTLQISPL